MLGFFRYVGGCAPGLQYLKTFWGMTSERKPVFALPGFCLLGVNITMAVGKGMRTRRVQSNLFQRNKVFQRSDVRIIELKC